MAAQHILPQDSKDDAVVLAEAFASDADGLGVLGLVMHMPDPEHYVALRIDKEHDPCGVVLLDSRSPGVVQTWTAAQFRHVLIARREKPHVTPVYNMLRILDGWSEPPMDEEALAFQMRGGRFDASWAPESSGKRARHVA